MVTFPPLFVARAPFIILFVVMCFHINDGPFFDFEFAVLEEKGIPFPDWKLDITGDIYVP
jgi:hypothetical protein